MDKSSYKAVPYTARTHHDKIVDENEPWNNFPAYDTSETRYCIVSTETGEILDDAQGYGYKTAQKAYAAFAYKHRDKSKDKERRKKKKHIENWMKQNKDFVKLMDYYSFEIAKGSMGKDEKFNTKFVRELLKTQGLEPDFKASELLRVWNSTSH